MKKKSPPTKHRFTPKVLCSKCGEPEEKHYIEEDQSKNGVRVIMRRWYGGTTVEASCACLGARFRTHSDPHCPNLIVQ